MKNSLVVLLTALIFIFPFNSCNKDGASNPRLIGQWQLESTTGGISGGTIKPSEKIVLIFNQDSTYALKEDGTITVNGYYHVKYDTTYGKVVYLDAILIVFLPGVNGEIYAIQNNNLTLTDYMISDGYSHYFKRIK
ncbi:MAG: hypothetical protein ABI267_01605 [Ginsengibacter sp.]